MLCDGLVMCLQDLGLVPSNRTAFMGVNCRNGTLWETGRGGRVNVPSFGCESSKRLLAPGVTPNTGALA